MNVRPIFIAALLFSILLYLSACAGTPMGPCIEWKEQEVVHTQQMRGAGMVQTTSYVDVCVQRAPMMSR